MSAILREFTILGLLILIAPSALQAGEAAPNHVQLTPEQRCKLERLVFDCQVKLAARAGGLDEIKARLHQAEGSAEWFRRRAAGASRAADAARLKTSYLSMATHLATAYGRATAKARREKAPETARRFLAVRSRSLKALRESTWAGKPAGRLWLAEQFLAAGDHFEARKDYRTLLDKFDPDGDGQRLPDGRLLGFDELKDALRKSRGFTSPLELQEAREELEAIGLRCHGRSEKKRGQRVIWRAVDQDCAGAARLTEKFLKDHPGYGLGRGGKPGRTRRALVVLKGEMEFRECMLRARIGLLACCAPLGREAQRKGRADEAAEYFGEGLAESAEALRRRPRDAELRLDYAECLLVAARAEAARREYFRLRRGLEDGGALWWRATRGLHRAHLAAGDRTAARRLLARLRLDYPRSFKKHFPKPAR